MSPTVLITGSTSGIGLAGAEELARRGWQVIVHARSTARGEAALGGLRRAVPGGSFELVIGDLASMAALDDIAAQVLRLAPALDVLWNNAGGMQDQYRESADGVELQMAVNHLAPFVLTRKLLAALSAAPAGRVVGTSSMAHAFGPRHYNDWFATGAKYQPFMVYGKSKLANILFTQELNRRLAGTAVTAHCFHPGWVSTGFGGSNSDSSGGLYAWGTRTFALRPEQGAATGVFLVDDQAPVRNPGEYWVKQKVRHPAGTNPQEAAVLWEQTETLATRLGGL